MGAWTFALCSRCTKVNCKLGSRRLLSNTAARLQEIVVEEPSSWRLFPAKGEVYEEQVEVGPHVVTFETGKLARFASGAVVVGIKNTQVLTTVVGTTKLEEGKGFLPLQVDYREKHYAQGKIPNTFMRREGAPKERELLVGRVIDRSIRTLFPKGYYYETQVMSNVLCVDGEQDPDILAACGASAALMVSDIPWNGPVGVVRVGRVDGKLLVNPDMDELTLSDLNLVYACTAEKTIMMETQAREITNNDLKLAFQLAHAEAAKLIAPQIRLASKVQNQKRSFRVVSVDADVLAKIRTKAEVAINTVMGNPLYGKFERGKALSNIQADVEAILKEEGEEQCLKVLPLAFDQVRKEVVRKNIFEKGERVDGRRLDEVRDLQTELDLYTPLHGSSLFSRGNTQVLCTVTLGAPEEAQKLDSLVGPPKKRFMLHYSFPPYCINEVGRSGFLNRREVGHGNLAEKALLALLPEESEFPYSVRVNSEVMASDGSTSMATVCGGSLALMNAGVPLRSHVAGVSVGLVTILDEETGQIKDYKILTDILGLEDHVGDMDFKIAGTRSGITAIQLDIKLSGIPLDILCEALEPARVAREHILDALEQEIREPNVEQKENAPRHFSIQQENVRRLIGPHGSIVKNIERTTGVRMTVSDEGRVCVIAKDQASFDQAKVMVDSTVGKEIEIGNIYSGCVTQIKDFGAFLEIEGGYKGLLHISELSHQRVGQVQDAVILGQKLSVMCIGRDIKGNLKLSLKATLPLPENGESTTTTVVEEEEKVESIITTASTARVTALAETERKVLVYEFPSEKSSRLWRAASAKGTAAQDQGQVESPKRHGLQHHKGSEVATQTQGEVELSKRHGVDHQKGPEMDAQNQGPIEPLKRHGPEHQKGVIRVAEEVVESIVTTASTVEATAVAETERKVLVYQLPSEDSRRVRGAIPAKGAATQDQGKVESPKRHGVEHQKGLEMAAQNQSQVETPKRHGPKHQKDIEYHRVSTSVSVTTLHGSNGDAKSRSGDARLDSSKVSQINIDDEYEATVHSVRALGAVLKLHNGELGKMFFDEDATQSNLNSGDQLLVRCVKIDRSGRAVFTMIRSL